MRWVNLQWCDTETTIVCVVGVPDEATVCQTAILVFRGTGPLPPATNVPPDVGQIIVCNDLVCSQAEEAVKKLEAGVMEAQNRESQMIEMSQWMTEITQLLQSRLDADILAGDTPKEFQVPV